MKRSKASFPSAVTLIQTLAQHLQEAAAHNDPDVVKALADQLRQQADVLAAVPTNLDPEDIAPQPPAPTVEPPVDLSPVQIPPPPVE